MEQDEQRSDRRSLWIGLAAVLLISFLAYLPVWDLGFTNWDDDKYVTENLLIRGWSPPHIRGFFGFFEGNFHPITLFSLSIDYRLGGLNPRVYHVTALLLHLVNTVLVFRLVQLLLRSMPAALLAAAIFGVHTFHVESVAWVSARKDLVYALFFLSSSICYVQFARHGRRAAYLATLGFFLLALGSKGMAVSLPLVLIAIDYFENRDLLSRGVILEKVPFLLISFGMGMLAVSGQAEVGALGTGLQFSWVDRLVMAGYGVFQYFFKSIFPVGLSAFYPHPPRGVDIPPSFVVAAVLSIFIVLAVLATVRFSKKYIFGFAFFFFNVVFILKFHSVGDIVIADRYSYVASLGVIFMMAAAYEDVLKRNLASRKTLHAAFGAYVLVLAVLTYQRCAVWHDSLSLWNDVLAKYPNAAKPLHNRGYAKHYAGDNAGSLRDFDRAIELDPSYADAHYNRANVRFATQDVAGAIEDWTRAIALNPDYAEAYFNRGLVYHLVLRDAAKAIEDYDRALESKPDLAVAWYQRGVLKLQLGDAEEGCGNLKKARRFGDPNAATALADRCP